MLNLKKLLKSTTLCASLILSFGMMNEANSGVLLKDWNGSGESGFGSLAMDRNDDDSSSAIVFDNYSQLKFDSGLNFFGATHNEFFINNNGNITFNAPLGAFTPQPFPLPVDGGGPIAEEGDGGFELAATSMIAPFWGDVDTSCASCGEVYIGSPNENTLVVTWNEVGFYSGDSSLTNTFQLALIDREDTGAGNFDIEFRYEDINWTTGDASNGVNGLGGTPAQAGFDAGDGVNFFVVPGSRTASVVDLDTANSNTGTPGIWKFSVRDGALEGDTAENPIFPVTDPDNPGDYSFEFVIVDNQNPIFIDPDVAIGYDYIVNSGPNIVSVLLPSGIGDNFYDLWLWDVALNDWYDANTVLTGGQWYNFAQAVDRFRIMGIEVDVMLDPTDYTAFVTGLMFDGNGLVNMNQTALTTFVASPTAVPEPKTLLLFVLALAFIARKKLLKKLYL